MIRISGAAAAVLLASVATASATTVEWRGVAVVTATTAACGTDYSVGNAIPMRYRPSGLLDNGSYTRFAFHQTFYAQSYPISGRFPLKTFAAVDAGGVGSGWGSFATKANFKMMSIVPATYTEKTPSLAFVGVIQNFGDLAGCTVAFRASAALK